jgi:ppGpp synthetase/RelA/SpoT-type nucleotidyltranferase
LGISKARIDRAGAAIARSQYRSDDEYFELEELFDEYRKSHLQPLSETTLELQSWLDEYGQPYYIAQRLKRKPQIVSKLRRLSIRLSQLQDIGGARIIVPKNGDVDRLFKYLKERVERRGHFAIERVTDYREKGRDRTGYRALHLILSRSQLALELQVRSRVQHYWAESIERTSVIYGYHLKEEKGERLVLEYFQRLSDAFHELEAGRQPDAAMKLEVDALREKAEQIIRSSPLGKVLDSHVHEGIIKTLIEKEKRGKGLNNWIIVFDWNNGSFVSWEMVGRSPDEAIFAYTHNENTFSQEAGFEVVLIGSSDVATVRQTHSHYFGIETYDSILESLETSIVGFRRKIDLDIGARQILLVMYRRRYWGAKSVSVITMKNHYCKNVLTFNVSLAALIEREFVLDRSAHNQGGISLNLRMKSEIEACIQ